MSDQMGYSPESRSPEREEMKEPEDVGVMLELHKKGWGTGRIAGELGISRNTVRRYVRQGGWKAYKKRASVKKLDGLESWLVSRFFKHKGNAEVLRQELMKEHGIEVSLRTVERAVADHRQGLEAEKRATVRFETEPGKQMQIDFGTMQVEVGGKKERVYLFVGTLGHSRSMYVCANRHERQSAWFGGMEGAFEHFGGVPEVVLVDNAKALVRSHDPQTREVAYNERFKAFARYWGFRPQACAPYRARTKGKAERSVGYVKRNGIAGRSFESWEELQGHLISWNREVAEERIHGTTGERPRERFAREDRKALQPLRARVSFQQVRELSRIVGSDASVEVDTNNYSVPWRLIGRRVTVQVNGGRLRILLAGEEIASHVEVEGERQHVIVDEHLVGIYSKAGMIQRLKGPAILREEAIPKGELLRPLAIYQSFVEGGPDGHH